MDKKHFEKQFPSLKKNVFWEKQKTSERVTEDRIDYENACVDVSQVAEHCIDKQNFKEIPAKSFLIKIPEASQEELNRWKKELDKLNRQEPIFLVNQDFELDTDWIKKEKVKEAINKCFDKMISRKGKRSPDYSLEKYEEELIKELGLE